MGITGSSLNLEDSLIDGKEGNIESTTSKIEDKYVLFTLSLLIKTVGNSGGSRFIDDSQYVETGNGTSILGGLSL